jgi:DNA-binding GntR family transcriptional regulator
MLEPFARTYVTASVPGIDLHWLGKRHLPIYEALAARDPEAAAEAMRRHANEAEDLVEHMEDMPEDAQDEVLTK